MPQRIIRIATRKSPLALWQANHVLQLLSEQWPTRTFELVPLVTSGDKFLKDPLLAVGGKGLFVKELEEALISEEACIAVHSTKDMPAQCPPGLFLAAICKRDNPFDALISKEFSSIDDLPENAIIGTASLRRQSQLLAYRSDLQVKPLRGNINTRLAKLESKEFQAIILAASGLQRLGMDEFITEILPEHIMLPSCGQGALCIECRMDDLEIQEIIAELNDPSSSLCVHTERQVNAALGGNCHVPLGVFCTFTPNEKLFLRARIGKIDGSYFIEDSQEGIAHEAHLLAQRCTQALLAKGAESLLSGSQQDE